MDFSTLTSAQVPSCTRALHHVGVVACEKLPSRVQEGDPAPAGVSASSTATRGSGTGASGRVTPCVPPPSAPALVLAKSASSTGSRASGAAAASVRSMLMQGGDSPLPPPPAAPLMRWSSSVLGSDVLLSEMQILLAMYPEGQIKGLHVTHAPPSDPSDPPQHDDDSFVKKPLDRIGKGGVLAKQPVLGGQMPARLSTGQALGMGVWAPCSARFTGETPEGITDVRCLLLRLPLASSGFDTLPEALQTLLWQCSELTPLRIGPTTTGQASATVGLTAFQSVDIPRVQPAALSSLLEHLASFRLALQAELVATAPEGKTADPPMYSSAAGDDDEDNVPLLRREERAAAALLAALPTAAAAHHFTWATLRLALEMPAAPTRNTFSTKNIESEQLVRVAFPEGYPRQPPVLTTRLAADAWRNAQGAAGIGVEDGSPLHPFALSEAQEEQLQHEVRDALRRDGESGAGVMFDVLQAVQEHSLTAAAKSEQEQVHLQLSRSVGRAGAAAWARFLDETHRAGGSWSKPLDSLTAILPQAPAPPDQAAAATAAAGAGAGAPGAEPAGPNAEQAADKWALLIRDMVGTFVVRQGCLMRAHLLLVALRALIARLLSQLTPQQRQHPVVAAANSFLATFCNLRTVVSSLQNEPVTLGESVEDLARVAKRTAGAQQSGDVPDVWTHFALRWQDLTADTFLGPRSSLLRQLSGRYAVLDMHDVFRSEAAVRFMNLWQRFQLRYGVADLRAQVSVGYCVLREGVSEAQVARDGLQHELELETEFPLHSASIRNRKEGYDYYGSWLQYAEGPLRKVSKVEAAYGMKPANLSTQQLRPGAITLVNTPSAAERRHDANLQELEEFPGQSTAYTPNFRIVVCAVLRGVTQGWEGDQRLCLAQPPPQPWAEDPESPLAQRFERARREFLARPSARQGAVVTGVGHHGSTYDSDTETWVLGSQPNARLGAAAEAGGARWQTWHLFDTAQVLPCYVLHLVPLTHVAQTAVAPEFTHAHVVSTGGSLAKAPRHTLTHLQQHTEHEIRRGLPSWDDAYDARMKNAQFFLGSRFAGLVQVVQYDDASDDDDDWAVHGMRKLPILTPDQATKVAGEATQALRFQSLHLPAAKRVDVGLQYHKAASAVAASRGRRSRPKATATATARVQATRKRQPAVTAAASTPLLDAPAAGPKGEDDPPPSPPPPPC